MAAENPDILVVEDEEAILVLLRFVLETAGWRVTTTQTVNDAWDYIRHRKPDLVVLDWMLGDQSGMALLSRIRGDRDYKKTPVIMLTAKTMEEDKIEGLNRGADDYITKPFSPKELTARVNALLRRHVPEHDSSPVVFGPVILDPAACTVSVGEKQIDIGHSEYRLLKFFMAYPNRAFTRGQLLDKVWGNEMIIEERTVDVHILRLRKALGSAEGVIKTIRSVGYMLSEK